MLYKNTLKIKKKFYQLKYKKKKNYYNSKILKFNSMFVEHVSHSLPIHLFYSSSSRFLIFTITRIFPLFDRIGETKLNETVQLTLFNRYP